LPLVNDRQFQMRVSEDFLEAIDGWRRTQPDIPARSEAIRRLVELGLEKSAAKLGVGAGPVAEQVAPRGSRK